jgi:beta-lactamase regulating signal transducer with metallopeptidase domain
MPVGVIVVDPAMAERCAWTLVHSLWQGAFIAALVSSAMLAMRRSTSAARYAVLCIGLLVIVVAPVVTFRFLEDTFDDPGPLVVQPTDNVSRAPYPPPAMPARLAAAVRPWADWILIGWSSGALALLLRQLVAWVLLQRLLLRDSAPLEARWDRLGDLARQLRLPSVRFLETRFLDVPATVGWLKPIVLLPGSALTGLPIAQLEAIVAHELAHIRRRDYLINVLQMAAEALMFYHPAVWWLSRRIREERENCCDDIAATVTGGGRNFADALLALEEHRTTLSLAVAATGGALWRRVARLVGIADGEPRPSIGLIATLLLLALGASHVLGSAVVIRPERGLDELQSTCGAVYEILELDGQNGRLLPALGNAISTLGNERSPSDQSLDDLATALNASRADELAFAALPQIHVGRLFAFERAPTWRYGTFVQRARLSLELWNRAQASYTSEPERAARLARASLLLAAQDSFMFGVARMHDALEHPDFARVARLDKRQDARLRRHLTDHRTITRACAQLFADADHQLDAMQSQRVDRASGTERVRRDLTEAMLYAGERSDIQLRVAKTVAQLTRITSAVPDLDVLSSGRPHCERWIAQAAQAPARGDRRRQISLDELIREPS